jgi:hypothetical protein
MFLFSAFDMYVVKVLEKHSKGKHQQLKYDTTFYVQQQTLGNTCGFYVCLNMIAFAQPNCGVNVTAFILLYY